MLERLLLSAFNRFAAALGQLTRVGRRQKQLFMIAIDGVFCIAAVWIAFSLRMGYWDLLSPAIIRVSVVALVLWLPIGWAMGVYRAIIRSLGAGSIVTLAAATVAMMIPMIAIFVFLPTPGVPRTVAVIQPMTFFLLMALARIVGRYLLVDVLNRQTFSGRSKRALIYGAGPLGQQLASSIRLEPSITLVGFIDDDPQIEGRRLDRYRVYHADQLARVINRHRITDVFLALSSETRAHQRAIVQSLQSYPVHVQTLPAVRDIVEGQVTVSHLREVAIEELLGRDPVEPDPALLVKAIEGKTVLVTGAGGSIGSELCRQIVQMRPSQLVLVEMGEYALYAIEQELQSILTSIPDQAVMLVPEMVNVADGNSIQRVMERWRPQTVFHAAAYKHVPLVEINVVGGARNNIMGTLRTALAAEKAGVERFILISTDKAVRPTNVMGATKRVCELVLQALAGRGSQTIFSMVRFGNVLGSSGSVVPLFQRQIKRGGPVTVTDSRVTRYFMTIPEAAQLVIQAGAMAQGGEVYVLDMGEPVKIIDFARTLIRLSGVTEKTADNPSGEIEIIEVGLRPGEKLYEELLIGNSPRPTSHSRVMQANETSIRAELLFPALDELEDALEGGDRGAVLQMLADLVPEYSTAGGVCPSSDIDRSGDFDSEESADASSEPSLRREADLCRSLNRS
jgi:FlaA1/EpsC-like NDP-sugar epimerase